MIFYKKHILVISVMALMVAMHSLYAGPIRQSNNNGSQDVTIDIREGPYISSPVIKNEPYYKHSKALLIFGQSYLKNKPLTERKNDALFVESLFKYMRFDTTTLIDPTLPELNNTIKKFIQQNEKPNTRIVIYYSGLVYNSKNPAGNTSYLMPIEANAIEQIKGSAKGLYPLDTVINMINQSNIEDSLMFIDACAASNLIEAKEPKADIAITEGALISARQYIIACQPGQRYKESKEFSLTLSQIMSGTGGTQADDGFITAKELAKVFIERFPANLNERNISPYYAQSPNPVTKGDFIFKVTGVNLISQLRYASEPAKGGLITRQLVFGREYPDVDANVIDKIPQGLRLPVVAKAIGKEWYKVVYEDKEMFVYGLQMQTIDSEPIILLNAQEGFVVDNGEEEEEFDNYLDFVETDETSAITKDQLFNGNVISDCPSCPEFVIVGNDDFLMGESNNLYANHTNLPLHRVGILYLFGVSRYEVTVEDYKNFITETGYIPDKGCTIFDGEEWVFSLEHSWQNPGFEGSDMQPVTCVNKKDVTHYIDWLNSKIAEEDSLKYYRLPSESEWEYISKGQNNELYFWGNDLNQACNYANFGDYLTQNSLLLNQDIGFDSATCSDETIYTAIIGSYQPNHFGLYDMIGNVAEITDDCWHGNYINAPRDGSAWQRFCSVPNTMVVRGGHWASPIENLRSTYRARFRVTDRHSAIGFRVVRTLLFSDDLEFRDLIN